MNIAGSYSPRHAQSLANGRAGNEAQEVVQSFPRDFAPSSHYFGGARSKGFATLRDVSKLQFFDKIGQAKSVGFRFYSAI